MNEKIYTNYRLQLPDQEIIGTLIVRDGKIAEIQPGIVNIGQNGEGEYLMPGLIELHTDNLEKCMSPRPGVKWPLTAALSYHDRDVISSGITTVCDAISIGDIKPNSVRVKDFGDMIEAIFDRQKSGKLLTNHRLHLRCELSFESVCNVVEKYATNPILSLMSLMDHTPGQRQFVSLEKYKEYYMGKHGVSEAEMNDFITYRQETQKQYAPKNRQALVDLAKQQKISLASHDDATINHVKEAVENGAVLAEFPTTFAAAKAAHNSGLQVLMGAPNLVLGGSHSGNVSAMELVEQNLVDVISSDYVPRSLLQSVFLISHKTDKPVYEAMKLVTSNPAKTINLFEDRGSLEVGKRADLITVHDDGIVPHLTSVVINGRRVA
ncbi:phosphonate metabolism protein PhnM [Dapis sp. BLCC M172]|uniref:phosphonate metabolism protein PhnM n=1 Tax=Dapis sp. BLCC M172 TaxID=2975281 RepID=UPI003CF37B15